MDAVLHTEVGHRRTFRVGLHIHILAELRIHILDALHQGLVFQDLLLALEGQVLQKHHGVVSHLVIEVDVDVAEHVARLMVPYPPHVMGDLVQTLQFFRQSSLDGQDLPLRFIYVVCFNLHNYSWLVFIFVAKIKKISDYTRIIPIFLYQTI